MTGKADGHFLRCNGRSNQISSFCAESYDLPAGLRISSAFHHSIWSLDDEFATPERLKRKL